MIDNLPPEVMAPAALILSVIAIYKVWIEPNA